VLHTNTAGESSQAVFVFLDEVNTCSHMGLISEAICHGSVHGERLGDGIKVLTDARLLYAAPGHLVLLPEEPKVTEVPQ
jgi:hypothetical protein